MNDTIRTIPFTRIPVATTPDDNGEQETYSVPFCKYQDIVDRLLEIDMGNAVMVTMPDGKQAHALRTTAASWHMQDGHPFGGRRVKAYRRGSRVYLRLVPLD